MDTMENKVANARHPENSGSVSKCLEAVELKLGRGIDQIQDDQFCRDLGEALKVLHAALRAEHAASHLNRDDSDLGTPEYTEDEQRLVDEHYHFLGNLDRIIRQTDSIGTRPPDDQLVYTLRIRELFAMIRRHEAERNRLLYMSLWQDVGGES